MDALKKIFKIIAIIAAIAGVVIIVKKILDKKNASEDSEENYVSCSCCEAPVK